MLEPLQFQIKRTIPYVSFNTIWKRQALPHPWRDFQEQFPQIASPAHSLPVSHPKNCLISILYAFFTPSSVAPCLHCSAPDSFKCLYEYLYLHDNVDLSREFIMHSFKWTNACVRDFSRNSFHCRLFIGYLLLRPPTVLKIA